LAYFKQDTGRMERTTQNWLFKYKLYHIPFWCLYHYLWWTVALGNPLKAADSIFFSAGQSPEGGGFDILLRRGG